jgi:regulatory protein
MEPLSKNERPDLRDFVLKKLSRREHSSSEIIRLAVHKGYGMVDINRVVLEFELQNWLSDERFAEAFTRDKLFISRWAPGKVVAGLRAKGVDVKLARRVVESIAPENPDEAIEAAVRRKVRTFRRFVETPQRKKKILEYLLRKGFDPDAVYRLSDRLLTIVSE